MGFEQLGQTNHRLYPPMWQGVSVSHSFCSNDSSCLHRGSRFGPSNSPSVRRRSQLWQSGNLRDPCSNCAFDGQCLGLGQLHHRGHTRSRRHVHEHVQGEQVNLAAHQVRSTWLSHSKKFRRFSLRHATLLNEVRQRHEQGGTGLHAGGN